MSGIPFDHNANLFPGMDTVIETVQNQVWFDGPWHRIHLPSVLSGAARDAGNTVTTVLRSGLLLGRVTATGLLKEWNPTGTDGSEVIVAILQTPIAIQRNGSNTDRYVGDIIFGGNVFADRLIIPGEATEGIVGHAREWQVVEHLFPLIVTDKHWTYRPNYVNKSRFRFLTAAEITADAVTVTEAENGKTFLMTGGDAHTTFTLPAAEVGYAYTFIASVAAINCVVKAASGTFTIPGDVAVAAATGVTLAPGESATFIGVAAGVYALTNYTQVDAT